MFSPQYEYSTVSPTSAAGTLGSLVNVNVMPGGGGVSDVVDPGSVVVVVDEVVVDESGSVVVVVDDVVVVDESGSVVVVVDEVVVDESGSVVVVVDESGSVVVVVDDVVVVDESGSVVVVVDESGSVVVVVDEVVVDESGRSSSSTRSWSTSPGRSSSWSTSVVVDESGSVVVVVEVDVVVVDESGSVVVVVDDVDVEVDVVDVVDEVVVDDVVDDVEVVVDVVVGDGGHPWPAKVPLRSQSSVPFQRMVTDQVWSWGCDHGKAAWKLPVVVQSSSSSACQSCATPSITTVRTLPGCGHVARSTLRCGQFGLTTPEPFAGNVVGGNVDVEVTRSTSWWTKSSSWLSSLWAEVPESRSCCGESRPLRASCIPDCQSRPTV